MPKYIVEYLPHWRKHHHVHTGWIEGEFDTLEEAKRFIKKQNRQTGAWEIIHGEDLWDDNAVTVEVIENE